jgi:hypothetical protein
MIHRDAGDKQRPASYIRNPDQGKRGAVRRFFAAVVAPIGIMMGAAACIPIEPPPLQVAAGPLPTPQRRGLRGPLRQRYGS